MKFSYAMLKDLIQGDLPAPHKLADVLSLHSYEAEGVIGEGEDAVIDLDILPNRASDSAGHIGIARDICAILGLRLKQPEKISDISFESKKTEEFKVNVKDKKLCDRYSAVFMEDVKVAPSPDWLVKRLSLLGLNSINNLVDIANYVMLLTGQPLHIFDYDKIEGQEIIVKKASKGEIITGLDDNEYELEKDMLTIADKNNCLGIAGIKGGKMAEVDGGTKKIIIESAHFDPSCIRRTSKKLKLQTDASWRFERNVPNCFTTSALEVTAFLIKEVAGGQVKKGVDVNNSKEHDSKISFSLDEVHKTLGSGDITEKQVAEILGALEFWVKENEGAFEVMPPAFRLDINIKQDVVEEIVRVYGYDKIEPKEPEIQDKTVKQNIKNEWKKVVAKKLSDKGFFETKNIVFVGDDIQKVWGYEKDKLWELENPINHTIPFLRPFLLPNLIKTAQENIKYDTEDYGMKFFEIGNIFRKEKVQERTCLSLVIIQKQEIDEDYLKNFILSLFEEWEVVDVSTTEGYFPGTHALNVSGKELGIVGNIDTLFADSKYDISMAEINVEALLSHIDEHVILGQSEEQGKGGQKLDIVYEEIVKYPIVKRDISLFVSLDTDADSVKKFIFDAAKQMQNNFLVDIDLFDEYKQPDKLSIAFHLHFQSREKTLESEEIDKQMVHISDQITSQTDWKIR